MTKVLNVDELLAREPAIVLVIDGERHTAILPTVEDFLENLKDMEALSAAPDMKSEIEMTVRMIVRAFPSLNEDRVKKMPVEAIEKLFAIVRGIDETGSVEKEDASGNEKAES